MSAPATPATRILAQGRFETGTLLRNGEQLLVSMVLPVLALVALTMATVPDLGGRRIDVITPGVLALAVVSTAFTGQAILTGFDRRYGVLRLLGSTPLGREGLLAGKLIAVLVVLGIQVVVLGAIALVMGWRPSAAGLVPGLVTLVLGALAFTALALALASRLRSEAVLALANLLWVLFLGLGLLLPVSVMPESIRGVTRLLPSGALGEAARASFGTGAWPLVEWLVLVGWAVVAGAIALRTFRWSD